MENNFGNSGLESIKVLVENNYTSIGLELFKILGSATIGYYFANKNQIRQANRKEDWELLNGLKNSLSETTEIAISYYAKKTNDTQEGIVIQTRAKKIISEFYTFLKVLGLKIETKLVQEYRQALTLNIDKISTLDDGQREDIGNKIIEIEIKLSEFAWDSYRKKHREKTS